jgi:hypothetical protein
VITILVGGREYDSWDALPEPVRAQLLAAGVDPGPDGQLDSLDLSRAGGAVSRHTLVTGPDGKPLPPWVAHLLEAVVDALGPAQPAAQAASAPAPPPAAPADAPETPDASHSPTAPEPLPALADGEDADGATSGTPRRVPLLFGWIVIGATVLLVATVVVIGLSGV